MDHFAKSQNLLLNNLFWYGKVYTLYLLHNTNNMTPSDKAIQLEERFRMNVLDYEGCSINSYKAKQCAIIAIEEILNALSYKASSNFEEIKYFVEVKKEIEKL